MMDIKPYLTIRNLHYTFNDIGMGYDSYKNNYNDKSDHNNKPFRPYFIFNWIIKVAG